MRLKYPGACSLEYQNVIEIFITCLLKWNRDKQKSDGPGILGNVIAFAPAHEEQARYTLHSHWQVWVEELSGSKREGLFDVDPVKREQNRKEFYKYVDSVMKASYTTPLCFDHSCTASNDTRNNKIKESELQHFRNARNEAYCRRIEGRVLECSKCEKRFSPKEMVENTFNKRLESYGIFPGNEKTTDATEQRLSAISNAQIEVAAFFPSL